MDARTCSGQVCDPEQVRASGCKLLENQMTLTRRQSHSIAPIPFICVNIFRL